MQHGESTQVRGVVKSFHQTPKGDVDGLVLEDGSELRFAPHFGAQVTGTVELGDEVTCAGHPHVDPKGHQRWRAEVVTHVRSGRSLELEGPSPEKAHHGPGPAPHEKGKPHADHVPPHEQMLTEIRAIRAAVGGDDEPTHPGAHASPPPGPPHEQVLRALRGLRSLVERRGDAPTS